MSALMSIRTIPFFKTVVMMRFLWVVVATLAIETFLPLGTPTALVVASGALGVVFGSVAANSRIKTFGFAAALALILFAVKCLLWGIEASAEVVGSANFLADRLWAHAETCLFSFYFWVIATWVFWRVSAALIIEVLALFSVSITLVSGHRGFHMDRPKALNSIAWRLGIDHLTMLTAVGSILIIVALIYLFVASRAVRPRIDSHITRLASPRRRAFASLVLISVMAGVLFWVQQAIYGYYNETMLARVANGVGMSSSPGVSPLSFQSALGSTNQPAGLVRLEGDYSNNPFSPMMYLRESALSSFNGKEMVFAGRAFDDDLPLTTTRDSFSRKEDADLGERTPLIQSIYLLAEHDHAFAVDYPISIVQLKNPRPNRFKSAYRAYSVAPAYRLSDLPPKGVGDTRWSQEVREHFLTQHPDTRYAELAKEITKDVTSPLDKVTAITTYMSRTAIYTLTPRHEIKPEEDPVAPFLFGDHRGYCVHFAHAIVYMARSLGIPARIGTGYLTDLSQAKDGHILLRMSDRHAWAEIFVTGIGWVPFDVQPDQVESHAETQVDAKLLEELMGVLEPGEEILPKDSLKDEAGVSEPDAIWVPSQQQTLLILGALVSIFGLSKLLLVHGWRLAPTSTAAIRWGYISLAARFYDLGIARDFGETRAAFAARTPYAALKSVVELVVANSYSSAKPARRDLIEAMSCANKLFNKLPWYSRLGAVINPASCFKTLAGFLSGGSW